MGDNYEFNNKREYRKGNQIRSRLVKIIRQSTEHIVGLYPFEADDFKESENDVITDCTLTLEINRSEVVFNCYSELNIESVLKYKIICNV